MRYGHFQACQKLTSALNLRWTGARGTVSAFRADPGYQRPVKPVPGDCGYLLHAHKLILPHPTRSEVRQYEKCISLSCFWLLFATGYLDIHVKLKILAHSLLFLQVIKITAPLPSVLRTQEEVEEIESGAGDDAQ
ncbi:hypothetical protein C3L33_02768, partial [Rhododendron williamsianum]